jgi:hypothetical protein
MIKWISGNTATGKVMVRRKQRLSAQCPLCPFSNEDTTHILQCPSNSTSSLRQCLLLELQSWLSSVDTQPDIQEFLISGLTSWLSPNSQFSLDTSIYLPMLIAFNNQIRLGWEALLYGFISSSLLHNQHEYYKSQGSRKSGTRWGIRLTSKLWNIIFQIWMNRNNSLHETEFIEQVSGTDQLNTAIILEHAIGIQHLPHVYLSYFSKTNQIPKTMVLVYQIS